MEDRISERDWKQWRKLSAAALETFCAGVLKEAAEFQSRSGSAHSRYRALFRLLRRRDHQLAEVFDAPRRSTAFQQIAAGVEHGMISEEDLRGFSHQTQAVVRRFLEAFFPEPDGR